MIIVYLTEVCVLHRHIYTVSVSFIIIKQLYVISFVTVYTMIKQNKKAIKDTSETLRLYCVVFNHIVTYCW